MTTIVDPTKAGKYPVVLSDALLGKDPKEIFTGIRYNHKPSLSSPTAPAQARIKPSSKKANTSYDLSFQDDGGRYQYKGTRGAEENQYVMIFDPAREVFVIHKVDTMFNMNLVQTPSSDSATSLRQEFPQLESHSTGSIKAASKQPAKAKTEEKKTAAKPRKAAPKPKAQEKPSAVVPEKKPPPKPTTTAKAQRAAESEEDESSDDDLGLTIENPAGSAPKNSRDFSPNIFGIRPFSDFVQQNEEEEQDDADGEDDDDDYEHFKLPSPINHPVPDRSAPPQPPQSNDGEEDEDEEMEDVPQEQPADDEGLGLNDNDALEAALLAELEGAEESDVSEEE